MATTVESHTPKLIRALHYHRTLTLCAIGLAAVLLCNTAMAQKEYNIWRWGRVIVDFNDTPAHIGYFPNAIPGVGNSTLSDPKTGALVCTFNGESLYDSAGEKIAEFAMQSGDIAFWMPGSDSVIGCVGGGLGFALVRRTPNGLVPKLTRGLVFHIPNTLVSSFGPCLIRHANERDYWVVCPGSGPLFHVFLIDTCGFDVTPIVYNSPTGHGSSEIVGSSADGTVVAPVGGFYHFNRMSGQFVSELRTPLRAGLFSPDGSRYFESESDGGLYEYDLRHFNVDSIIHSKYRVPITGGILDFGAVGQDGKLYFPQVLYHQFVLGVIENPDSMGAALKIRDSVAVAYGELQQQCNTRHGIATVPTWSFALVDLSNCNTHAVRVQRSLRDTCSSWVWSVPDASPSTSTDPVATFTFDSIGTHQIMLIEHYQHKTDTLYRYLYTGGYPLGDALVDTTASMQATVGDTITIPLRYHAADDFYPDFAHYPTTQEVTIEYDTASLKLAGPISTAATAPYGHTILRAEDMPGYYHLSAIDLLHNQPTGNLDMGTLRVILRKPGTSTIRLISYGYQQGDVGMVPTGDARATYCLGEDGLALATITAQSLSVQPYPPTTQPTCYPNPAESTLTIKFERTNEPRSYHIIDATGRDVLHGTIPENADQLTIDVHTLPPGAYELTTQNHWKPLKFVVER